MSEAKLRALSRALHPLAGERVEIVVRSSAACSHPLFTLRGELRAHEFPAILSPGLFVGVDEGEIAIRADQLEHLWSASFEHGGERCDGVEIGLAGGG